MTIQTATTYWEGDPVKGKGLMTLGSGHLDEPYSFASRFGDGKGTSPEELLGAAYSGSFSMALAHELTLVGYSQVQIQTSARVCITNGENGYKIESILLNAKLNVPGITVKKLNACVKSAKDKCLLTKVLFPSGVELKTDIINSP